MTEMDYLKMKLEDKEKAFDKLFKRHMDLLKQQGELEKENEQLKKDNEHLETCFKMADSTYTILQKQYWNIEIALSKCRKENENLKKALWEVKTEYIEEKNEFSIDIERDMEFLKEEFERGYWND